MAGRKIRDREDAQARYLVSYIKTVVRELFHRVGLDIRRWNVLSNSEYQLHKALEHFGVDMVFDVGANRGQFARGLRSAGYVGTIVSFEPPSLAYEALQAEARHDTKWHVHERCAVGDHDGTVRINIAANSVSSSVLPMTTTHSSADERSAYVGAEEAKISRLDSIAPRYSDLFQNPFLKIDTQGFESQVLDGAQDLVPRLKGVMCELSLVRLYDGQILWLEMLDRLRSEGFEPWTVERGFTDPRDGRTLQIDVSFFRDVCKGDLHR
jgi:FkbM family methyltransferase